MNGSLLPASVISLYCAYLCYTGLSSEPRGYECNGLNKSRAVSTSTLVLGMLTTVLSVLYSALRAGSSTTFLSPPSSPRAGNRRSLESFMISHLLIYVLVFWIKFFYSLDTIIFRNWLAICLVPRSQTHERAFIFKLHTVAFTSMLPRAAICLISKHAFENLGTSPLTGLINLQNLDFQKLVKYWKTSHEPADLWPIHKVELVLFFWKKNNNFFSTTLTMWFLIYN